MSPRDELKVGNLGLSLSFYATFIIVSNITWTEPEQGFSSISEGLVVGSPGGCVGVDPMRDLKSSQCFASLALALR